MLSNNSLCLCSAEQYMLPFLVTVQKFQTFFKFTELHALTLAARSYVLLTRPWNLIQNTRPSFSLYVGRFKHEIILVVAMHAAINKNTVLVPSHMIPNLLSLLISLAITCSIHTPHVFPSLLHTREKSGISITMAIVPSQLHFNTTSVMWLATVATDTFPDGGIM